MILIDSRKKEVLFFFPSRDYLNIKVVTLIDEVDECFKGVLKASHKEIKKFRVFVDDSEILRGVVK